MSNIFEGSEKKLEIVLKETAPSLRDWPEAEWLKVIEAAGAQVLSKISNKHCNAYLLSESSLFVWDHSLVLITCGTTTLVRAAEILANKIPEAQREAFFFQRKNEYFPHLQKTHFYSDVEQLQKLIPGHAYRLGSADEHHMFLYNNKGPLKPSCLGSTLEVLMYDLQGPANEAFNCIDSSVSEIRNKTKVNEILSGFEVDDFCFKPTGYSLNALKDKHYYTVHVTPQEESPYVSFETNAVESGNRQVVLAAVLETFRPQNFDVVLFDENTQEEWSKLPGYSLRNRIRHDFDGGFQLQFSHFSQGEVVEGSATPLRS